MTELHRSPVLLHVRCPRRIDPAAYRQVVERAQDVTPQVQVLPPAALIADVTGSLRYHRRGPADLARMLRTRVLAHSGIPLLIGVGPSWSVAAMASRAAATDAAEDGGVLAVEPQNVTAWLHPQPVRALDGIGPAQERTLTSYGVHTIGLLAHLPEATVQQLIGGRAGRLLRERARGLDHRTVVATDLPRSTSTQRRLPADTLAPELLRSVALSLAVELGERLRGRRQAARALTLTVGFAGGSQIERSRRLSLGASAHTDDLRDLAYDLLASLGLQRARVRGLTLRCDDLVDAATVAEQLSFEPERAHRLTAEKAVDRLNQRFGPRTAEPAATYRHAG
ncbi:DNA polymerase Y family protein [Streptomyces zhihengii]|uniref:UmuC domain-containing protein n=1 Tax=Streptomyces zhihengii TaxID=1818004 RepID=A0ABS2V4E1_9ACTN|nr:hypothetical protein [Streptomyces zhihengii]MBM9624198.1 hypothetical protein [Streptomyces zhihengii]